MNLWRFSPPPLDTCRFSSAGAPISKPVQGSWERATFPAQNVAFFIILFAPLVQGKHARTKATVASTHPPSSSCELNQTCSVVQEIKWPSVVKV